MEVSACLLRVPDRIRDRSGRRSTEYRLHPGRRPGQCGSRLSGKRYQNAAYRQAGNGGRSLRVLLRHARLHAVAGVPDDGSLRDGLRPADARDLSVSQIRLAHR